MSMKRITLDDVARIAGVSRATVSRVMNDHINIREEVRNRVKQVIAETGYHPHLAARSLASNRSNILGLVVPSTVQIVFTDPYFPLLIQGITQACNANHYTLSLFLFHTVEEEHYAIERIVGAGLIDGLIITADTKDETLIAHLLEQEKPFVQIGRPQKLDRISFVDVDNVGGSYSAVKHLIEIGYHRIATIATRKNTAGQDRLTGYRQALTDHGEAVDNNLIVFGDYSEESGYLAMKQLLSRNPDAVFVGSDTMALGALRAIQEAGISVPNDVALASFDDLPATARTNPPITTVRQPIKRSGMVAVETLFDILQSDIHPPRHIILPTELIVRSSSIKRR
jgi:LacI family transcriptional regulator